VRDDLRPSPEQEDLLAALKPKPAPLSAKIVGLDMSLTHTAVAVLRPDGVAEQYEVFGYQLSGKNERQRVERVIGIANSVLGLIKKHADLGKPEVAIEGYAFGKQFGREPLAELQGFTKCQLFLALGVVATPIPPQAARKDVGIVIQQKSVRKKVDGKWEKTKRAEVKPVKEQVREQLLARGLSFPPKEEGGDDQMDAYVVARALWVRRTQGDQRG
jgi:hypothetical protein